MTLQLNLISGCMLGFEVLFGADLKEPDDLTYVIVDLFIIRITTTF